MNKTLSPLLILVSFLFGQSGGQNLEKYLETLTVMVGMNQSFYGSEWNDYMKDAEDSGTDVDLKPFRKMNFTVMNEFKEGLIGGVKYLHYGYDYKFSGISYDSFSDMSLNWSSDSEIELKFYKLFLTYPMGNGIYIGIEGGYFVEGESDFKYETGNIDYSDGGTFDREDWEDGDPPLSAFDYGVLGQFYYNINKNILATVEGYYGLSKFIEDYNANIIDIPNVFHYVNLGIAYKLGKKSK